MKFANRTAWPPGLSDWGEAVEAATAAGSLIDLTRSNPVSCGLGPSPAIALRPLALPEAFQYAADPLGMGQARAAVAGYYRDHGRAVPLENLCLTTSTSEAYSFLFRLLCDGGDEVLIARPSYPLLDLLGRLHDVSLREYPLWHEPGASGGRLTMEPGSRCACVGNHRANPGDRSCAPQ